jgi:aminopeptidase
LTIDKRTLNICARNIVKACNLSKGDTVFLKGGQFAFDILESVALECYRKGAIPSVMVSSDNFVEHIFKEIPASTIATVPKHILAMIEACDMVLTFDELADPSLFLKFPRKKLQARQKSMLPIIDVVMNPKRGKKWLSAGWPSRPSARAHGVTFDVLKELIIGGMSVPPETLMRIGGRLDRRFREAAWVHVWDNKGTDFRVKVEGRRTNLDDAMISKADYDAGDLGANLPAGELFIAPHETVGEGSFFCPVTRDHTSVRLLRDVHFEFKRGRILLDTITARDHADAAVATFKESEQVDKGKFDPVRTLNIAELGVGYNPRIRKAIGYILTDEKVAGTVHVAFGMNRGYGGTSDSVLHWDFVSAPGVDIEVERLDGKTVHVMHKGKFV